MTPDTGFKVTASQAER